MAKEFSIIETKLKYKKMHRGQQKKSRHLSNRYLNKGSYGLVCLENKNISVFEMNAFFKYIEIKLKALPTTRFYFHFFPNKTYTKRSSSIRMGKGKGDVKYLLYTAHYGNIIVELDGIKKKDAYQILNRAKMCLKIKTAIISKNIFKNKNFN